MDYSFGNMTIRAPLANSILEQDGVCGFAATSTSGSRAPVNILGDPFLRSAYVVYDQDNKQISLAQYSSCGTNEQSIPPTGASCFVGQCGTSSVKNGTASTGHSNSTGSGYGGPVTAAGSSASIVPGIWALIALVATSQLF
jgi:hypothetical protein